MFSHAVRRGLEHPSTVQLFKRAVQDGPKVEIPKWGMALLVVTFIGFVIFLSAVEYTLKQVVATLCMVETPSAAITVSASEESAPKDAKEGELETSPVITLVHQKPITSSIRATVKHLVSHAGTFARWRGYKIHVLYAVLFFIVASIVDFVVPNVPGRVLLISGLTGASLANIHASWTHKVVSMPTTKSYWQRIPSRSNWKLLALPAAVESIMPYIALYIAQGFVVILGLDTVGRDNFANYSGGQWASLILRSLSIFAVVIACSIFLCLPAIVTLVRIESSILPEDQDTIVPFDRTFAGKVVPKILGGTGAVSFLDAWRSFNWEARRRIIKLYLKTFVVLTLLFLILAHLLAFETFAILGSALGKYLSEVKQQSMTAN